MKKESKPVNQLSDAELWCLALRSWNAVHRLRQLELAKVGLTVEQSSILVALRYGGGSATSDELEEITLRQQHSISTITNRMAKNGLLDKVRSPEEKKSRVYMTEYGRKLYENTSTASVAAVFSCLGQAEKKEFAGYLDALRERVRDLLGTGYRSPFMQAIEEKTVAQSIETTNKRERISDYRLWMSLDGAGFAMSRLRQLELAKFGLTVEQSIVMMILWHEGAPIKAGSVRDLTFRQHNSISALINRMAKAGLISKAKKPGEKSSVISLTQEGKDLFKSLTNISLEMVFSRLQTNERIRFINFLGTVHDQAREILGYPVEKPASENIR